MKKLLLIFLLLAIILSIGGCTDDEILEISDDEDNFYNEQTEESVEVIDEWAFYNERAKMFVTAMAVGDFEEAVSMFDDTMMQVLPASVLQSDVWDLVVGYVGEFISVHETENLMVDGYYISFITSHHENSGVTLRVVFSEEGLIAGLFVDAYPEIDE